MTKREALQEIAVEKLYMITLDLKASTVKLKRSWIEAALSAAYDAGKE